MEEDNSFKNIALIPGGFKPPTLGHFYTTLEISKRDELDEVIVLIGHGVRDGIDKEKSLKVWEIYKKYLPPKVNIKISEKPSPVGDVNSIIKNNPNNFYFPVVGVRGEQDLEDIKRFDSLKGKYDNFKPIIFDSDFKVSGALEIRQASYEFERMKRRILKHISQRTAMLSGISHDLKTPLTRLKLQIELLNKNQKLNSLKEEITEMEKMINEYLS